MRKTYVRRAARGIAEEGDVALADGQGEIWLRCDSGFVSVWMVIKRFCKIGGGGRAANLGSTFCWIFKLNFSHKSFLKFNMAG